MTREQIIEAMAMAAVDAPVPGAGPVSWGDLSEGIQDVYRVQSIWTLDALEAAIPGLAEVIAERARIVPVEPTEEMTQAAGHLAKGCRRDCTIGVHSAREVYRAMIEAGKAGK